MRIRPAALLLILALPAAALRLFPLVSYSTGSGFLFGGVLSHNLEPPMRPFAVTTMAYVYTSGSAWAGPRVLIPAGRGMVTVEGEYASDRGRDYYGWGNGGDDDVTAEYDSEQQRLAVTYAFLPAGGLLLTAGLEGRHTVVFDREESDLWELSPTGTYGSSWSAGPLLEARWDPGLPLPGYLGLGLSHQAGDGFSYSGIEGDLAVFASVTGSTMPSLRLHLGRHLGSGGTPFEFLPHLGGEDGLRGYGDRRFMGDWTLLGNLEVRQRLATIGPGDMERMEVGLVLFGDMGQVSDDLEGMTWDGFHLDAGVGARLVIPGGAVLRADFALSPEGLGVQMALGELF